MKKPDKFTLHEEAIVSLWGEEWTLGNIAKEVGVHRTLLCKGLKKRGFSRQQDKETTLSEAKRRAIRLLHENGFNDSEIVRIVGCSNATVKNYKGDNIVIGKTICSSLKTSARAAERGGTPKLLIIVTQDPEYDAYMKFCLGIIEQVERETGVKLNRGW